MYLRGTDRDRDRSRDPPSVDLLPNCAQQLAVSQADARNLEPNLGLLLWWQLSNHLNHHHSPRTCMSSKPELRVKPRLEPRPRDNRYGHPN